MFSTWMIPVVRYGMDTVADRAAEPVFEFHVVTVPGGDMQVFVPAVADEGARLVAQVPYLLPQFRGPPSDPVKIPADVLAVQEVS